MATSTGRHPTKLSALLALLQMVVATRAEVMVLLEREFKAAGRNCALYIAAFQSALEHASVTASHYMPDLRGLEVRQVGFESCGTCPWPSADH